MENEIKKDNTLIGKVVSNKMQKTLVVLIERAVEHPRYKKIVKRTTKLHVHIPDDQAYSIGDVVRIKQSRPISKLKTWVLVEKIA